MRAKLFFFFSVCTVSVFGQGSSNLLIEAGLIWRTTVGYYRAASTLPGGSYIHYAPYDHSNGVNGTGMNFTIGYKISEQSRVIIRSGTTIRYDFFRWNYDKGTTEKTVYFDQTFFLSKSIFKKAYIGAGITMFSIGKEFDYKELNGEDKTLSLDFNSLDLLFGVPVWKIYLEPKISYVDHGFPGKIKETATILGIRTYYRFNFKTKRHTL